MFILGSYRVYTGLYWDNGKENGHYYLGFRSSTCVGLSIHAPMASPHFQESVGGGMSCPANFVDIAPVAIETGLSFKILARRETSQATTQIASCQGLGLRPQFPPQQDHLSGPSQAGGP